MDEGKGRWSLGGRASRRSVAIGVVVGQERRRPLVPAAAELHPYPRIALDVADVVRLIAVRRDQPEHRVPGPHMQVSCGLLRDQGALQRSGEKANRPWEGGRVAIGNAEDLAGSGGLRCAAGLRLEPRRIRVTDRLRDPS